MFLSRLQHYLQSTKLFYMFSQLNFNNYDGDILLLHTLTMLYEKQKRGGTNKLFIKHSPPFNQ